MAKAVLKTQKTDSSVAAFIKKAPPAMQEDCKALIELMKKVTGEEPRMWGAATVGFGEYHYVYESGREGDWFKVGFSPRKTNLTLYLMNLGGEKNAAKAEKLFARLGKFKMGKSCVYLNRLADVDTKALAGLIELAVKSK